MATITLKEHNLKKALLQKELQKQAGNQSLGLNKKTSNLFRDRKEPKKKKLNVGHFNRVINIDPKNRIVETEGMITYDDLVKETLKKGFMPAVVPQLKTITIGGAISGLGIESSSFREGLVHEAVEEIEVLLSDGTTVVCTPKNKNKDLFLGLPNSYGTLGYVLRLKSKIIPVKRFVELNHLKYSDPEIYFKDFKRFCDEKKHDFVDGVIFSENEMYITLADFIDKAPYKSDYKHMGIYYKSIRKRKKDYLTVSDYIWRWDPDWFWGSKKFGMQNPVLRAVFGKLMLSSYSYWKIISLAKKFDLDKSKNKESVVQDVGIPIEKCSEFLRFFTKNIGILPIWACPFKSPTKARFTLVNTDHSKLYIDFGFWDSVKTNREEGFYNRLVEKKVWEMKGLKSLYSTSYYTEEEFWRIHNKKRYNSLKRRYDPNNRLRNLYEKCVKMK